MTPEEREDLRGWLAGYWRGDFDCSGPSWGNPSLGPPELSGLARDAERLLDALEATEQRAEEAKTISAQWESAAKGDFARLVAAEADRDKWRALAEEAEEQVSFFERSWQPQYEARASAAEIDRDKWRALAEELGERLEERIERSEGVPGEKAARAALAKLEEARDEDSDLPPK